MRVWLLVAICASVSFGEDCKNWPPPAHCGLDAGVPEDVGGTTEVTVERGEYNYFTGEFPTPPTPFVTIALSVVNGDPDLYVKFGVNTEPPSASNFDFSSRLASNEDVVTIRNFTDTRFSVAVYGFRASTYTIMYGVPGTTVTLINNQPQTGSVSARDTSYYSFSMADPGAPLVFTVTTLTGDPDLLVNKGTDRPTITDNDYHALDIGDDVVTIDVPATEPADTPYTIGVYGSINSEYIITASQAGVLKLLDGLPQSGSFESGVSRLYQLATLPNNPHAVTFSFTVASGALQYYAVSNSTASPSGFPDADHHFWSGTVDYFSPASFTVAPGDDHFLADAGSYVVRVVADTPDAPHASTNFTLSAKTAQSLSPLQDGVPKFDRVAAGQYAYYSLSVSNTTLAVTFDLTPSAGDPDMYISCNKTLTGTDGGSPSRTHATWQSQAWGEDTITIDAADPSSCLRQTELGGTFFVAVFGFNDATFSITAALANGQPTTLSIGQPQAGHTDAGATSQFSVVMPDAAADLTVTVSPAYGDPDLYVTVDGTPPSATNYAYRSFSAAGPDTVVLSPDTIGCHYDTPDQCYCTSCRVNVAVVAFSNTSYTLTATTAEAATALQDGVPVIGTVAAHGYRYYTFYTPDAGNAVQFSVTPVSGDADLAISRTLRRPTLADADYTAIRLGGDTLTLPSAAAGKFYIGVAGFTNSTFTLAAHIVGGGNAKQLIGGIPQGGSVAAGHYVYYYVLVDEAVDVTLTATPAAGQITLLANPCSRRPAECGDVEPTLDNHPAFTASDSTSQESVLIRAGDADACSRCVYVVGVYGDTAANFTVLVANSANGMTTLSAGVPQRFIVDHWAYKYFRFQYSNVHRDVIVAVTPFSGDPDVYVTSCGYSANHPPSGPLPACEPRPSNTSYTWRHANIGADAIAIPADDPDACIPQPGLPCDVYVAVHGYTRSDFTVVARLHSADPVLLLDGKPQNGHVNTSVTDQYTMEVPPGATNVEVLLIPLSGDADLYVTLDGTPPSPANSDYRSISSLGNDHIEIGAGDAAFTGNGCGGGCTLRVAVVGYQPADYSVMASTSHAASALLPGIPVRDSVPQGGYDYYQFVVDSPEEVDFVVTPLSGDPDLYVGWGPAYERPNRTHSQWHSQVLGVDVVTVRPGDADACDTTAGTCVYHVAVFGYTESTTFSIMASVRSAAPVRLLNGVPQTGRVDTGLTNEYAFVTPAVWSSLQITLTPLSGDADLYVKVGDVPAEPANADYRSTAVSGNELVVVREGDDAVAAACPTGDSCQLRVGVFGYSNATYTVVLTTDAAATDLQDGTPLFDTVQDGAYVYYTFHNDDPGTELSFALTPFAGDPDMYVTCGGAVPQPTKANYTWHSAGLGRDVVEIQPNDPSACAPPTNYHVGVTAFASNATFSVLASQTANAVVQLVDGQPQLAGVQKGSTREYILLVAPGTPTVLITLTPLFGDADLYVKLGNNPPTSSDYDYLSIAASGSDSVRITSDDPAYKASTCDPAHATDGGVCGVRVAVKGFADLTFYALVASSANARLLQEDTPVRDTAAAGTTNQYMFQVDNPTVELVLTLTPLSGDPDLFADMSGPANASHFSWKAATTTLDVIEILPGDPASTCDFYPCRYYIGVSAYGSNDAQYSLLATTNSASAAVLVNGQPQVAFVNTSRTMEFSFDVPASAAGFTVTVDALYGDPDLFMRLDGNPATHTYAQYRAISTSSEDSITVSAADPNFGNCTAVTSPTGASCTAYIAVFGFRASRFTITATTDDGMIFLREGQPQSESVPAGQYEYFVFTATSHAEVTLTLTPLTGDPDMFVATAPTRHPRRGNATWSSQGLAVETVTLSAEDPAVAACGLPCQFYIGVTGFGSSAAAFQLLATVANATRYTTLLEGDPQHGSVAALDMVYFLYRADADAGDLTFSVTPLQGTVEVFVTNEVDAGTGEPVPPSFDCTTLPCQVHAQWSSYQSFDRATVTVPTSDDRYCADCFYVVGVVSAAARLGAEFSVVASDAGSIVALQAGTPYTSTVATGEYDDYKLIVTDPTADVVIVVSAFYGDPDLYVSWHASNPTPGASPRTADLSSVTVFNDTITVPAARLGECAADAPDDHCQLYVSVRGFVESSYSIVARLNNGFSSPTILLDGSPQSASVERGGKAFFAAYVDVPATTPYTFTLTPDFGDPDMYVTTTPGAEPSRQSYNFSASSAGVDVVTVSPEDPAYCNRCLVNVVVYGFTDSDFALVYNSGTNTSISTMRDGVPVSASVPAGGYQYFKVFVDSAAEDLSLSLSPRSGSPALYAIVESRTGGAYTLPTAAQYTWSSASQGGLVTTISHNDVGYVAPATYVIGVTSPVPASFSLTASLSRNNLVTLRDGQPQTGTVAAGAYTYFRFSAGGAVTDITFRVSNPALELYATNLYDGQPGDALPTAADHVWASTSDTESHNVLTIAAVDPAVSPAHPVYTVGVHSATSIQFTLTASTASSTTTLSPGTTSTRHHVAAGQNQRFLLDVQDLSKDVVLSVTALTGDPDLYVSSTSRLPGCFFTEAPNPVVSNAHCQNYTWSSQTQDGDLLHIVAAEPCKSPPATAACDPATDFKTGPFFISVFGYSDSTYDISAILYGVNTLTPGQPVTAVATSAFPATFSISLSDTSARPSIKFDLDLYNATSASVYVTVCGQGECVGKQDPSPTNNVWAVAVHPETPSLFIADTDPHYCTAPSCTYYIAVFPGAADDGTPVTFQMRATVQDGSGVNTIRYEDIAHAVDALPDVVPEGGTSRYELWLGDKYNGTVHVTLEACKGVGSPAITVCGVDCPNPAAPTDPANAGHAQSSTVAQGTAALNVDGASDVLYMGVTSAGGGASASPYSYVLRVTAAEVPYHLMPATNAVVRAEDAGVTEAGDTIVGLKVEWDPAVILSAGGPLPATPMYYVYATPVADGWGADVVDVTACGLMTRQGTLMLASTRGTVATIDNLAGETEYLVNVVAVCDEACWASAGVPADAVHTDTTTYTAGTGTTPVAPGEDTKSSVPVVPIVVGVSVVGVLAVIGTAVYCRRRRAGREYQYELYDVSGHDGGSYSTTAYSAME